MDTSISQACLLAAVKQSPGISGPALSAKISEIIPPIQFHQHLARLRNRGLIITERQAAGPTQLEISLTDKGEAELAKAHGLCKFVVRKCL